MDDNIPHSNGITPKNDDLDLSRESYDTFAEFFASNNFKSVVEPPIKQTKNGSHTPKKTKNKHH